MWRWIAVLGFLGHAAVALAQDVALGVTLPAEADRSRAGPSVTSSGLLADRDVRELLRSGFPARLHYRLQLWNASGLFNAQREQVEWDVIVRYNPLERRYTVSRLAPDTAMSLGTFDQLPQVESAIGGPYAPPVNPPKGHDKYYYVVLLQLDVLSVSDLSEVERWLRGELQPAVKGERNPGTALGRGIQTLVVRLLGGEQRVHQARTPVFRPQ
ncbi:MAG TPA: hypothetical protein VEI06_17205 [Gemmatimonadaceae bacterium]|nr:hypothetical protein [Gemmatimonadaceae bacterium]